MVVSENNRGLFVNSYFGWAIPGYQWDPDYNVGSEKLRNVENCWESYVHFYSYTYTVIKTKDVQQMNSVHQQYQVKLGWTSAVWIRAYHHV